MKYAKIYFTLGIFLILLPFVTSSFNSEKKKKKEAETTLVQSNIDGKGTQMEIDFIAGKSHNHPTLAVWVEDLEGNYIQTLFVTKALATGVFGHGEQQTGVWKNAPGEVSRPATLPYFLHKRGKVNQEGTLLPTANEPIPDAYSGATPPASFQLTTRTDKPLKGKFRLLVEVNQPWDWNSYWNNNRFPGDIDYKTSCQPALVYAVTIDLNNPMEYYVLNPMGHSHYSGKDGLLYTDISSFTTALHIFDKIEVKLYGIK